MTGMATPPVRQQSRPLVSEPRGRNWIVVASADHAQRGQAAGFMQACHGKAAPLRRVRPADLIACYSPTTAFRGKDKLRAFTAIGVARDGEPYQFDMGGGFRPFRRDVAWLAAQTAPIQPLLDRLEFTSGSRNWGYQFRFGLFAISDHDMEVIAEAMSAQATEVGPLQAAAASRMQQAD
jgi:hypothetical protein